jgi:hypothetical protein
VSTRCTIGYETCGGGYVGVYCHYDGYPKNIVPSLIAAGLTNIRAEVERALREGGLRSTEDGVFETFGDSRGETSDHEMWLKDSWPCTEEEYNYRVARDGTITCVNYRGVPVDLTAFGTKVPVMFEDDVPDHDDHLSFASSEKQGALVVLNDGETYTDAKGCVIWILDDIHEDILRDGIDGLGDLEEGPTGSPTAISIEDLVKAYDVVHGTKLADQIFSSDSEDCQS